MAFADDARDFEILQVVFLFGSFILALSRLHLAEARAICVFGRWSFLLLLRRRLLLALGTDNLMALVGIFILGNNLYLAIRIWT